MTKTTAHSDCTHPSTKGARAACRKTKATVQTVTTDYGTFEIKTIAARNLKKTDAVLFRPQALAPFFNFPIYDAFQTERINRQTGAIEKTDTYNVNICRATFVSGDTEYTVAVDPEAVRVARLAHTHQLHAALRSI